MSKKYVFTEDLEKIADAIRSKSRNANIMIFPQGFVNEIKALHITDGSENASEDALLEGNADLYENTRARSIHPYCFFENTSLKRLYVPSVQSIGRSACIGCINLTEISIENVNILEDNCFEACKSLKTLYIPVCRSIGMECFKDCISLASVELGSAEYLDDRCFSGCTSLKSVKITRPSPPQLGNDVFAGVSPRFKILVPESSFNLYKNSPYWAEYATKMEAF